MSGIINKFLREYMSIISIVLTIIGVFVLIIGAIGTFTTFFSDLMGNWNLYVLIIGFILFLTGVYYFYSYITKKRFVLSELETNKRSEFIKKHKEVKNAVKYLPKKYSQFLTEKEKELKIK